MNIVSAWHLSSHENISLADAVKWENKYLESTPSKDDADQARQRLSLYEQKKPYHEAKKPN